MVSAACHTWELYKVWTGWGTACAIFPWLSERDGERGGSSGHSEYWYSGATLSAPSMQSPHAPFLGSQFETE